MIPPAFIGALQKAISEIPGLPWYARGPKVQAFLQAVGLTLDGATEATAQGLRLMHPLRCDSSHLPTLSRDRGIRIYETEPTDSKRRRLADWLPLRRQFGTQAGQGRNLQPFFLPDKPRIQLVHATADVATWHQIAADGTYTVHRADPSNWDWDGAHATAFTRYWVIVNLPPDETAYAPVLWDDAGNWDDAGLVWGGYYTSAQIADIVAACRDATAAHESLWGVMACYDETGIDPAGTAHTDPAGWTSHPTGNWVRVIDDYTGKPTRPPYVHILYDRGQG